MNTARPKIGKGIVEAVLDEAISEEEMDHLLAGRRDEINAKLQQAHDEKARGEVAPLEPLHVVLREARERLSRDR